MTKVAKTSGPFVTLDSSWRRRKGPAPTSRRTSAKETPVKETLLRRRIAATKRAQLTAITQNGHLGPHVNPSALESPTGVDPSLSSRRMVERRAEPLQR